MEMEKKNIALIILVIALVASGVGNVILALSGGVKQEVKYRTLIVGTGEGPAVLDPLDSWDSASNDVIEQVVETLFTYDLSDPELPVINLLAESYSWNVNVTELTVILRKGIVFHDEMPFNATAVKWNVDRWLYLTNSTGLLPANATPAFPSELYFFPDHTPIIEKLVVNGEYNVTFYLTAPFAAFIDLLTYTSFSIISPYSHAANDKSFIDLTTGDLIGTGPFLYDYYKTDIEVRFTRWDRYWRTGSYFEKLVYTVIDDANTRNEAMLNHEIDVLFGALPEKIAEFNADPTIVVKEMGSSLIYYYLAFNNHKINVTWRKALSYAINYSYLLNEILGGLYDRAPPAVPAGMPGHNASVQANLPTFNVSYAREIMQSMGFGVGLDTAYPGNNETQWKAATFATVAFGHSLELNEFQGSWFNDQLNTLLESNWDLIGVDTHREYRTWGQFLDTGEKNPDALEVWYVGWAPDYLDPYNMLAPLYLPSSASNFAQINITLVNELIVNASKEPDKPTRLEYYKRVQYILFLKEFVHAPLMTPQSRFVHSADLKNFPYNTMGRWAAWYVYK